VKIFIPRGTFFSWKLGWYLVRLIYWPLKIIMSVKFSTILSQFYPDYHKVWNLLDCCLGYIRLIPSRATIWGSGGSNEFLVGEGENGWSIGFLWCPIGQWSLLLYDVSACHSNSDARLEYVIEKSIVKKVPLAMLCLVGSFLLRRKRFSRISSTAFPWTSVWKNPQSPCYFSAIEVA